MLDVGLEAGGCLRPPFSTFLLPSQVMLTDGIMKAVRQRMSL
jgi:hypothetical protein